MKKPSALAAQIAVVLALAVPGSVAALWLSPRSAEPAELPPLVVPHVAADQWLASLATRAAQAPEPDERETRRRELYLAHGLAEAHASDPPHEARARSLELHQLGEALAADGTLDAIRSRDVQRGIAALRGSGSEGGEGEGEGSSDDARVGELGIFPAVLARYGALVQGRRVAPEIVLYALFWARWNAVHDRELTDGLEGASLLAYHGWLVYYGPDGGTDLREGALVDYVGAGGGRGLETAGYLRLAQGDVSGARLAFEAAYEATGNVRLRNNALALSMRGAEDEGAGVEGGAS